jgi:hypothetical protein
VSVFTNPTSLAKEHAAEYVAAVFRLLGEQDPLDVLERTPALLKNAVTPLSVEQVRRPEQAGKWSVRDVVQHLADSELVSAVRVRMVLAQNHAPLVAYDQDVWAERLRYSQADAARALEEFTLVRRSNLRLLRSLATDDWARVGVHVERGEQTLADMVRLSAGHDLVHLNQIDRILGSASSTGQC